MEQLINSARLRMSVAQTDPSQCSSGDRLVWDAAGEDVGQLDASHALKLAPGAWINRVAKSSRRRRVRVQWFHDFQKDGFDGWYVTGEAFGNEPTRSGQWDTSHTEPRFVRPGLADSGVLGRRLQGVLRSPTFVLGHRRIHYRMSGHQARIRLIVDGYVMDIHNALLFQDNTLENVETKGEQKWVTQHRDLYHYLGHRAHIEIIDAGDGYASVEKIGFSDGHPPVDAPHSLCIELVGNQDWSSTAELATSYEQLLTLSLTQLRNNSLRRPNVDLLNWLLDCGQLVVDGKQLQRLRETIAEIDESLPQPVKVMALADGDGEDEKIHIRGSHNNLGDTVHRRLLVAIAGESQPQITVGSGRLELAERMVDPDNPFISRVLVNRLWYHLFGQGIVPSVDDFGAMGQPPSHLELLDWLALDFVDHG